MMLLNEVSSWLIDSAIFGAIILATGSLAVYFCREPIYRIRIIQWTFAGCLLVPLLQQLDHIPAYHMALWNDAQANREEVTGRASPPLTAAPTDTEIDLANTNSDKAVVSPKLVDITESSEIAVDLLDSKAVEYSTVHTDEVPAAAPLATSEPDTTVQQATLAPTEFGMGKTILRAAQMSYGVVIAGLLALWCINLQRRSVLARSADPAGEAAREALVLIAGPRAAKVRLLVSSRVAAPIMWGVWRATIVIPRELASTPNSAQLKWGLAHEWSHVIRGDFLRWLVANIAKFACFYQPAYWWMRRQLLLSQDYLADAFAAKHGESAEDYAAFLVSLARARNRTQFAPALGIGDRRSQLLRRVKMLVQSTRPLVQRDRRGPAVAITTAALVLLASLSTLRLNAEPTEPVVTADDGSAEPDVPAKKQEEPTQKTKQADDVKKDAKPQVDFGKPAKKADKKELPEAITYTGKVVDRESGELIAGARVEIIRELSRHPKTGKWTRLRTTTHMSDKDGNYTFTVPPEEVAEPSLYLIVDAHHEDYQSKGRSGYSHTMIRKNLANGEPPFYETIKLSAGEPITGTILQPDGKPAANIQVLVYSKPPSAEPGRSFQRGAFQFSQTDDAGNFRATVATPGDGVFWAFPKNYSPIAQRIGDKRGNLGPIKLADGIRISGQVLDAKGNPVPNVAVNLRRDSDGEEADEFLNSNAVSGAIGTGAKTDAEGKFTLKPLPTGNYSARVGNAVRDQSVRHERRPDRLPVDHVFSPTELTISKDDPVERIVLRASPHIIVRGRFFNSKGKPRASHQQHLFGSINGKSFFANSNTPGKDGWFEFKVPHGAERVQVNLTTNEHSALRWRVSSDEELTYGRTIELGTLEADHTTLEVVRYEAPLLLLKAVDEDGKQVRGFVPNSKYKVPSENQRRGQFISGAQGDIGFEEQPDGRWRSSQLLPDGEVTITLEKEGFTAEPQTVTLKESEERELIYVLKKKDE